MFELTTENSQPSRFTRHKVLNDGLPMSFESVLKFWAADEGFRTFYSKALSSSSFAGFRWETPSLTTNTVSNDFEFVLVNSPAFCKRNQDPLPFKEKFQAAKNQHVTTFANLRGDATMIVPTPQAADIDYGHFASFLRQAPNAQIDNLWQAIGETVLAKLNSQPIWLSTAGGGVAWLHVRVDSAPKYYNFAPYRNQQ